MQGSGSGFRVPSPPGNIQFRFVSLSSNTPMMGLKMLRCHPTRLYDDYDGGGDDDASAS